MADKAFITPAVLKWGRVSAGITKEIAAAKVSVRVEKLNEWEEGTSHPTIRQAQTLAKAYKRPFALLFLPEIPRDFQPLQDFRSKNSKELGTGSIFIIREIRQKQAWLSEFNQENNESRLTFVGRFSPSDAPVKVAEDILITLNIDPANYKEEKPIKEWIQKSEKNGILISRTSFIHSRLKLDSEEMQGFAIADPYAPFVFINSEDWEAPQLFTLVHELAHIWIAETGISNDTEPVILNKDKFNPVELFCNDVAANALMPDKLFKNLPADTFKSAKEIFRVSKKCGVSSFALLVRALNLKLITLEDYDKLKNEATFEYNAFLNREFEKNEKLKNKEKNGGPNPYLLRLNKNGRLFTQIVLDSFRGGNIEPTQASSLLNTPVNKFSSLEAQLYR